MCDFLAIMAKKKINIRLFLKEIIDRRKLLQVDEHGWGLAFKEDGELVVVKEPLPAWQSSFFLWLEEGKMRIKTDLFILHVRKATQGDISWYNTHPFYTEWNGKKYVFAHKGDVSEAIKEYNVEKLKPLGETDSEKFFLYVLEKIINDRSLYDSIDDIKHFSDEIGDIGKLNYVLTDGETMLIYDGNDEEPLFYSESKKYFAVASESLRKGRWKEIGIGHMIVIREGKLEKFYK